MNNEQKTKVESIVFKKLIEHLQNRTDVQNIDLMNLSGFCRNCLSRWYSEAAEETGLKVDKDRAREIVYGMPHSVWKEKYQTDANEIPTDIQVMINNNEKGAALLRIVEVIGQDELERMDEDTISFVINTLNQLNIDIIRNKILLKVLPLKV